MERSPLHEAPLNCLLAAGRSQQNAALTRSQVLPGSGLPAALPLFWREAEPPHARSQAEPEAREHAPPSGQSVETALPRLARTARAGQCDSARATQSFGETTEICLLETGARTDPSSAPLALSSLQWWAFLGYQAGRRWLGPVGLGWFRAITSVVVAPVFLSKTSHLRPAPTRNKVCRGAVE
jgi:hypothetical protein